MKSKFHWLALLVLLTTQWCVLSGAPGMIHYQGRVTVNGAPVNQPARFKFALIRPARNGDATPETSYWSNDGTSTGGQEPTGSVQLTVSNGLYSVHLGDTGRGFTAAITPEVLAHEEVHLRVWFSPDGSSFQQVRPDQRIASVAYAVQAQTADFAQSAQTAATATSVAPGAIGNAQIANGSITAEKLAFVPGIGGGGSTGDSLHTVRGVFNIDRSRGAGYTVTQVQTGKYLVTFNTPFLDGPAIQVQLLRTNTDQFRAEVNGFDGGSAATTDFSKGFTVYVVNSTGGLAYHPGDIRFIAVGPR